MNMIGSSSSAGQHLGEDALARLLDEEASPDERQALEHHVRECAECRAALASLRSASERFRGVVTRGDVALPVLKPPRRRVSAGWKPVVLAAVLACVLVLFAVSPTRAWIIASLLDVRDLVIQLKEQVAGPASSSPESAAQDMVSEPTPNQVRVSIPLVGDVLHVTIRNRQRTGSIAIQTVEGEYASAEIIGGGTEEMFVSVDGLEIGNRAESTSSYTINVPATVSVVMLQVGDEPVRRFASIVGERRVVDLTTTGPAVSGER